MSDIPARYLLFTTKPGQMHDHTGSYWIAHCVCVIIADITHCRVKLSTRLTLSW